MEIRNIKNEDIKELVKIYKEEFPVHNIFQESEQEIVKYLEKTVKENETIVAIEDDKVVGGLLLVLKDESFDKTHRLWKFKHVAVAKTYQKKGIGTALVKEAEKRINEKSKTAKIELTVSENEKIGLEFYKRLGYKEEGKLKNHYRWGETTYILSKSLG